MRSSPSADPWDSLAVPASGPPNSTRTKATPTRQAPTAPSARITPRIARKGVESSERLGRFRWVVERSLSWIVAFRRLALRYDRQAAAVLAFLHLACALISLRFLARAEGQGH